MQRLPPAPTSDADTLLDELLEEVAQKLRAGQPIDVESYARQHPDLAEPLLRLLPGIESLVTLGQAASSFDSAFRTGHSELEGTLGDYRIIKELGRGGMGVVYEAQQISLRRRVALKILPFAAVLDKRQLARFENEARAAATLEHPHIVPVYGVGEERGVHYYAMRLIRGQSLAEVIAALKREVGGQRSEVRAESVVSGPLSVVRSSFATDNLKSAISPKSQIPDPKSQLDTEVMAALSTEYSTNPKRYFRRIAEIGIEIAEALGYAHSQGILHRDVKPANILLDADGEAWLTDFGLAQLERGATLTTSGGLVGTLRYMSPEQVAGQGILDERTDIYSLGATLYELVTLQPAFPEPNRGRLIRQLTEDEPPPPRKIEAAVPRDLETIVLKAMSKKAADRYRDVEHVADDLKRFLGSQSIQARRPNVVDRSTKWARRHVVPLMTAAVVLLCSLSLGAALIGRAYTLERAQHKIAEREKARAEASLRIARQAIDDMYTNVATVWLADKTAATQIQQGFLKSALQLYRDLARDGAGDPTQRSDTAQAWQRIAEILAFLHEDRAAQQALLTSIQIREELAAELPSGEVHLRALLRDYSNLAEAYQALLMLDEADAAYTRGLTHLAALQKLPSWAETGHKKFASSITAIYGLGRAGIFVQRGDLEAAESFARDAHRSLAELLKDSRRHLQTHVLLAKANQRLTQVLRYQGKREEAAGLCETALRQCTAARHYIWADSRELQLAEISLIVESGELAYETGTLDAAEHDFRKALELQRQTFKGGLEPTRFYLAALERKLTLEPHNELGPFCGYVETQLRLSRVLAAQDRRDAAEEVLGDCTTTADIVCQTSPDVVRYRLARANSWAQVAMLLNESRPNEALLAAQWTAATWRDTLTRFPQVATYCSGLYAKTADLT